MQLSKDEVLKIQEKEEPKIQKWIEKHCFPLLGKNDLSSSDLLHALDFLKSPDAPRNLSRLSLASAVSQSIQWLEKLNKRNQEAAKHQETEQDIEVVEQLDKFCWVRLKSEQAYKREGVMMGHCVASYAVRLDCMILSLRDQDNQPHCTIEIKNDYVAQIKGKENTMVVAKYHQMVREFITSRNYKVDSSDVWRYGWLVINDKLVQETELPDEVVIPGGVEVALSKFAKLPKIIRSKSPISVSDQKHTDLSHWQVEELTLINCENITLPKNIFKQLELENIKLKTTELSASRLSVTNCNLICEKIIVSNLKVEGSYLKSNLLDCKVSLLTEKSKINAKEIKLNNFNSSNLSSFKFESLTIKQLFKLNDEIEEDTISKIFLLDSAGVVFTFELTKSWTWPSHWSHVFFMRVSEASKKIIDFTNLKDIRQVTIHPKVVVQGKNNTSVNVVSFLKETEENNEYDYLRFLLE